MPIRIVPIIVPSFSACQWISRKFAGRQVSGCSSAPASDADKHFIDEIDEIVDTLLCIYLESNHYLRLESKNCIPFGGSLRGYSIPGAF
jgi:hypothetical protein